MQNRAAGKKITVKFRETGYCSSPSLFCRRHGVRVRQATLNELHCRRAEPTTGSCRKPRVERLSTATRQLWHLPLAIADYRRAWRCHSLLRMRSQLSDVSAEWLPDNQDWQSRRYRFREGRVYVAAAELIAARRRPIAALLLAYWIPCQAGSPALTALTHASYS